MFDVADKPFFTNEEGTEFYMHNTLTEYAQNVSSALRCVLAKKRNGYQSLLLLLDNDVICENGRVEVIATKIDMMRVAKVYGVWGKE